MRHAGFLLGAELFDNAFFSISPAEAAVVDPQQRLLLERCYEVLHASGQRKESLMGTLTGDGVAESSERHASPLNDERCGGTGDDGDHEAQFDRLWSLSYCACATARLWLVRGARAAPRVRPARGILRRAHFDGVLLERVAQTVDAVAPLSNELHGAARHLQARAAALC